MAIIERGLQLLAATFLLYLPIEVFAQEATSSQHVPLQKTIGVSAAEGTKVEPSLIVMNADGAGLSRLTNNAAIDFLDGWKR